MLEKTKKVQTKKPSNLLHSHHWINNFNLWKVQCSDEDLTGGYQDMVVLIVFFCTFQIKRADLEPEIMSSTEETVLFYNRGI